MCISRVIARTGFFSVLSFLLATQVAMAASPRVIAVADAVIVAPNGTTTRLIGKQTNLTANDLTVGAGALTVSLVSAAGKGTAVVNANGTFSYHNTDPSATEDSFHYKVCAGSICDAARVWITISSTNPPSPLPIPYVVGDGSVVTMGGATTRVNGDHGLLDNDFFAAGLGNLDFIITNAMKPLNGTIQWQSSGTFTYTHDGSQVASDVFYYQVCERQFWICGLGRVVVTVVPSGQPLPQLDRVAAVGDGLVVHKGQLATSVNGGSQSITANDFNPYGGALFVTRILGNGPSRGSVIVDGAGLFSYQHNGTDTSADSFAYEVCDQDHGVCDWTKVNITVFEVGVPAPTLSLPQAQDDTVHVRAGQSALYVNPADGADISVLDNDTSGNGGGLLAHKVGLEPHSGSLVFPRISPDDGTLSYTDSSLTPGTIDHFQYEACDTVYGVCSLANVTVNVDPPHADFLIFKSHVGTLYTGQIGALYSLSVLNMGDGPSNGTVTVVDHLPAGLTATDMYGDGWSCSVTSMTCNRDDPVQGFDGVTTNNVYPPISVVANVPSDATILLNTATVISAEDTDPANNNAEDKTTVGAPPKSQTITFISDAPKNATVAGTTYAPSVAASSNLTVELFIDSASAGICELTGNPAVVSFIGAGTCTIDATQTGNATFAPAPLQQQSFAVMAAAGTQSQTIGFTSNAPTDADAGGAVSGTYTPVAIASSGLKVTISIDSASSTVCMINVGVVSYIGAGTCTVNANQGGNGTFAPAPQAQQSFAVVPGAGTQLQTIKFITNAPTNAKVGGSTYLVAAGSNSGLPVTLTIDATSSAVCALSGNVVSFISPGICAINANQGGNKTFAAAPQKQQSFAVMAAAGAQRQEINFITNAPANAVVDGLSYAPTAVSDSKLAVTLSVDAASLTVCKMNGGSVSFIGAGTCTINANQGGDTSFAPATQVQQSFAVTGAGGTLKQTITFTTTPPKKVSVKVGGTYAPVAIASSKLTVILTVDAASSTVCTLSNGMVSFISSGMCTINANQGGNAKYAPAAQVQQSFAVVAAPGAKKQTITFTSIAPKIATTGGSYAPTAKSDSNLKVSMTIDATSSSVCKINSGVVSFIGPGTCTINANQGGDSAFAPAAQIQQSFVVTASTGTQKQIITFITNAPTNATTAGATYGPVATSNSKLTVILSIDTASATVCSINGGTVSFTAAGTCTINANQGGNTTFAPAVQTQQSFVVMATTGTQKQTITFITNAPTNATTAGATYGPAATSDSKLTVILSIDAASTTVCSMSGGTVSFTGSGTCTINADQGGNENYAPAKQTQSFAVMPAAGLQKQTITFISQQPTDATVEGATYAPIAVSDSKLTVI